MGKGLDNYFLILGLDFEKPESDERVINQRIKEKSAFWNANSDKGKMQQKYRQYKSQVIDIGKVMKTENLRNAEAKDAMLFVNGILKEEKRFFAGKKEIEETAAKAIMEKCGLWPEMFEKLSGLKIIPDQQVGEVEKDPNPKPDKVAKFNKFISDLNILHKENLYAFLADGAVEIIGIQALDGEELIKNYSNPLKERVKNGRTEEDVSTKTLCAACEEIFDPKNGQLRVNYDKYLIWQKIDAVISRIVKYSGVKKILDEQQSGLFIDEMTQILRNRDEAVNRFQQICVYKGIRADGGKQQSQTGMSNQVLCGHCYRMSDISHGGRKCTFCGKDLYILCPQCGEEALASSKACGHCGFVFDNIKKAGVFCDMAEQALVNMDFDKARSALARASELAGKFSRIKNLQEKLETQEGIFAKEAAQMNALAAKKSFYKAAEILRSLQRKAPTAKIANAVLIETSVKEAEQLYKFAVKETSEQKLIEACSQIVSICADYPGVESLMLKYRPKPPANVKIECDSYSCSNMLTWEKSPSVGTISYKILRKANAAPASMDDAAAEEIGTAGDTEFIDISPKPGVNYYYNIYAMRAGVVSAPAYASAVNLSQLRISKKEEGDGYIRIEWEPLQGAEVAVCRGENEVPKKISGGEKIRTSGAFLLDDTVENNRSYYYLFAVTYHVGGKDTTICSSVGPLVASSLPEPVEDLVIHSVEDDLFEAQWRDLGKGKVMLYYTQQRMSLKYGDITDVDKVEKLLKPVDRVSSASGSCRFRMSGGNRCVVIPVTIKGQTAVIGEQAVVAKMEKIQVDSTELINSNLRIVIQWPKDAVSIMAVYGSDGYAKNLEDRKGKTVRNFSKEKYEADTGIYLQNIEKKDYFIVLYSATKINGEMVYSEGARVFYSNRPKVGIQYAIRVKGLFNKQIEVEFTSEEASFGLPDINLVCKQGGAPVYADSGTVVEHIDKQEVQGSYKVIIPSKSVPRNSYLKAFFADEDMSDEMSLRPVYGTNFKIS